MQENLFDAKILIVDDQQANIDVLTGLLNISGYTNHESISDSKLVMAYLREHQPDLLLLDLMMPDVSGFDILEMIKKDNTINQNIAILVLTADITGETKRKALVLGANDFLTKPFDLSEVKLRIKNLLSTVFLLNQLTRQNIILEDKVKERTKELTESLRKIKEQNESLRQIAWTQSHVVRAPLSRIMGVVYLLKTHGVDEKNTDIHLEAHNKHYNLAQLLQAIIDSANELDAIVRDISDKTHRSNLIEE